jgi:tetratricopeptide (TPR) repeat protein
MYLLMPQFSTKKLLIRNSSYVLFLSTSLLMGCITGLNKSSEQATQSDSVLGLYGQVSTAVQSPTTRPQQMNEVDLLNKASGIGAAPQDAAVRLKIAEDAYNRNNWALATREFQYLSTIYPRNSQIWFALGTANAFSGNYETAASAYEVVLRIDASDVRAAYNLSLIRLSQAEIALTMAQSLSGGAAPAMQQEINRLTKELSPAFNRVPTVDIKALPPSTLEGNRDRDPAKSTSTIDSIKSTTNPMQQHSTTIIIPPR